MTRRDLALIAQTRAQLADGSARLRRETAGIRVGEIAEVLGVSSQAVSMWEHARRVPDSVHALAYGRALMSAEAACSDLPGCSDSVQTRGRIPGPGRIAS